MSCPGVKSQREWHVWSVLLSGRLGCEKWFELVFSLRNGLFQRNEATVGGWQSDWVVDTHGRSDAYLLLDMITEAGTSAKALLQGFQ